MEYCPRRRVRHADCAVTLCVAHTIALARSILAPYHRPLGLSTPSIPWPFGCTGLWHFWSAGPLALTCARVQSTQGPLAFRLGLASLTFDGTSKIGVLHPRPRPAYSGPGTREASQPNQTDEYRPRRTSSRLVGNTVGQSRLEAIFKT